MTVILSASAQNSLSRGADILASLVAIESGDDSATVQFAPGELASLIASFRTMVADGAPTPSTHVAGCGTFSLGACTCPVPEAAPATAAARRMTPRAIQPPTIMGADGKLLRKMWLKGEDFTSNVFGPYIVGDTTKCGFVVRDTRTGVDEEFGRGKDFLAQALAFAEEALDSVNPDELDDLTAASLARIVDDGREITAR